MTVMSRSISLSYPAFHIFSIEAHGGERKDLCIKKKGKLPLTIKREEGKKKEGKKNHPAPSFPTSFVPNWGENAGNPLLSIHRS